MHEWNVKKREVYFIHNYFKIIATVLDYSFGFRMINKTNEEGSNSDCFITGGWIVIVVMLSFLLDFNFNNKLENS